MKEKFVHKEDWGINSMLKETKKRSSLLSYWTKRYFFTLLIGLIIVTVISVFWIRHTTIEQRLEMSTFIAEQTALQQTNTEITILPPAPPERGGGPGQIGQQIYIVDENGTILSSRGPQFLYVESIPEEILTKDQSIQQTSDSENQSYYIIKVKSENGWVVVVESKESISAVNQEYGLLAIFIISLGLLGWGAVYLLTRRLTKPIKDVANAAKRVQAGMYDLTLPTEIPELEMHNLIVAFNDMAQKLHKLESVRTELLAGVTHELKTPVTSISGLLQAVTDGVVEGEEKKEFLHTALRETNRLQSLVADLLDFNAYTTDSIPLTLKVHSLNILLDDLLKQWKISRFSTSIDVQFEPLEIDQEIIVDSLRLHQIFVNLLDNATQAIQNDQYGNVDIKVDASNKQYVKIQITDTGVGIEAAEQPYIFERFFRGEQKKYKLRGLGIGLPLSQMLARSMKGELSLKQSSEKGSTFELMLLKAE